MTDISKALELAQKAISDKNEFYTRPCDEDDEWKNRMGESAQKIILLSDALIEQQATLERYKAALESIAAPLDIIQIGEHGKQPISVDGNEWWVTKSNAMERVTAAREALEGSK